MVLYKWTQFNITETWSDAFLASFRERATFATVSVRDCVQAGSPFVVQKMKYYRKNLRYKGAKPIWNWSPSELISYIIILIIFGVIFYFSKL